MSHRLKNLNQKYYIALGIGIALIFLIIVFISLIFRIIYLSIFSLPGAIVALFLLIIALAIIVSKTFATNLYKTIIKLLIGAIIANTISLILTGFNINMIIVIVVCVVVLGYTLTVKKREELRSQEEISPQHKIAQEEISPQHKIAQHEYNMEMIKFAVGGGLIVIGIVGTILGLSGIGGLGVDPRKLNNLGGYILLGLLLGPPIIVFIVPNYFIVRSAYRKYYISKD